MMETGRIRRLWRRRPQKVRLSRSRFGNILVVLVLLLFAVFLAAPLIYTVMSSFKPFEEIFVFPPKFFVRRPVLDNYVDLFLVASNNWVPFSRYIFNSLLVSIVGTGACVLISSMAAYPLAKHNFPGKNALFSIIVIALLFTTKVTFVPQYIVMSGLGMINTYWSLILPTLGGSFGVFLMKQFMEQIPVSVLESARIDGASEVRAFFSIVMPQVKPAWLTLIIFTFQGLWNNGGVSLVYNEELKTLPTAFSQIASAGNARFGAGMAASVLLMLPPILAFIIAQSRIMETMAFAGIKE